MECVPFFRPLEVTRNLTSREKSLKHANDNDLNETTESSLTKFLFPLSPSAPIVQILTSDENMYDGALDVIVVGSGDARFRSWTIHRTK